MSNTQKVDKPITYKYVPRLPTAAADKSRLFKQDFVNTRSLLEEMTRLEKAQRFPFRGCIHLRVPDGEIKRSRQYNTVRELREFLLEYDDLPSSVEIVHLYDNGWFYVHKAS